MCPGRLAEHSYSIPGCLTPPDDSPAVSTPGHVTPYVSPPSSPPTLTPQRPLSPPTPELPSCPDTPKYKTNMLYRYLQDAAEAHETFAEDCRYVAYIDKHKEEKEEGQPLFLLFVPSPTPIV